MHILRINTKKTVSVVSKKFWIFSKFVTFPKKKGGVLLSPHSATFTDECNERMSTETIQNIIDFFENKLDKTKIVKL